jgi:hypothetical protein
MENPYPTEKLNAWRYKVSGTTTNDAMPQSETTPNGPDTREEEKRVAISTLFVEREFIMSLPPRREKRGELQVCVGMIRFLTLDLVVNKCGKDLDCETTE